MVDRILIIAIIVALLAGAFLLFTPKEAPSSGWAIAASNPLVIGGYGDNFSYAGKNVRPVSGTLSLMYDPKTHTGTITAAVTSTQKSGALRVAANESLTGKITLSSHITTSDQIITNADIYGDTGIGGPELPVTHALLAGITTFTLDQDGKPMYKNLVGEWSLAQALRKKDGAIRQSGLYYSPLLRDKTGFTDPNRLEFTLILHSSNPDKSNNPPYTVALQLVFTAVRITQRPPA